MVSDQFEDNTSKTLQKSPRLDGKVAVVASGLHRNAAFSDKSLLLDHTSYLL
jgi:hypothetical protein